jgi:hypothetical protein
MANQTSQESEALKNVLRGMLEKLEKGEKITQDDVKQFVQGSRISSAGITPGEEIERVVNKHAFLDGGTCGAFC